MTDEPKLKPCPCGGEAEWTEVVLDDMWDGLCTERAYFTARCCDCSREVSDYMSKRWIQGQDISMAVVDGEQAADSVADRWNRLERKK